MNAVTSVNGITVAGYLFILLVLFFVVPFGIVASRRYRWSDSVSFEKFLLKTVVLNNFKGARLRYLGRQRATGAASQSPPPPGSITATNPPSSACTATGLMLQNSELKRRPLNQQLETYLYSRTNYGLFIDIAQSALSLVSCGLVLYSASFPFTEPDPDWAIGIEVGLTLYFACDYALRFFLSADRLVFYFSPRASLFYTENRRGSCAARYRAKLTRTSPPIPTPSQSRCSTT